MHSSQLFALLKALNNPVGLFTLLGPIGLLLLVASCFSDLGAHIRSRRQSIVGGAAALCALTYTVYALHYPAIGGCLDHLEPTVVGIMRLLDRGDVVYHGLQSASRYAMLYGPGTFVVPWLVTRLGGDSLTTLKLMSAGLALASLALTSKALWAAAGSRYARWCGLAYFCAAAMLFREKLVWLRADPQLLFWSAAGLWGATRRNPAVAFAVIGLAVGMSFGAKAHAPLYFIPILAIVAPRGRPRDWAMLLMVAALTSAAPFVLSPSVSLPGYLAWLRNASHHGFGATMALNNIVFGGYVLLPVAIAGAGWLGSLQGDARQVFARKQGLRSAIVALGLLALLVPASKLGGGEWHLLPLMPVAAWVLTRALSAGSNSNEVAPAEWPGAGIVLVSFLSIAAIQCGTLFVKIADGILTRAPQQVAIAEDLRSIAEKYRGRALAMGYGGDDSYPTTFARVGLPPPERFVFDGGALMEMQAAGLALPEATLDAFRKGAVSLWLIPRGDAPFSMHNYYAKQDLFGPELRSIFAEHYRRIDQSRYFDVWAYVGPPPHLTGRS